MTRHVKKEAYVVFRGRVAGIYRTWAECHAQVSGFSHAYQLGYEKLEWAEKAWAEHLAKEKTANAAVGVQVAASSKNYRVRLEVPDSREPSDEEDSDEESAGELEKPNTPKRGANHVDFAEHDHSPTPRKKARATDEPESAQKPILQDPGVELTSEQEEVVSLAMRRENMFLTGAGGSGKTVTLKEILDRFQTRSIRYQVVAPTGLAALPLGGKTIHSFMGWKPDTLRVPIERIMEGFSASVLKGIRRAQVLIVEEISMVENQILERMNLILKNVMANGAPFGGKQVIFLGDFYQLPPVKPFEFCLHCGGPMSKIKRGDYDFMCKEAKCPNRGLAFREGGKWAFRAPVWKQLNLRHVQLQRIHRQKDKRFRDILTNIRYGTPLEPEDWEILERKKPPPPCGICPVRLMSRRDHVAEINRAELQAIKDPPKSWTALDFYSRIFPFPEGDFSEPWKMDLPLKNHRFPRNLVLKTGAKVVLLHNLDQKRGLVNGSQGIVVGFQKKDGVERDGAIKPMEGESKPGPNASKQHWNIDAAPVVQFANGTIRPIFAVSLTATHGTKHKPYLATRVQVPLALAWALTIHKSQGMTLDYIEVSSRDIFETGQFYVALSRGTHLEGLTVTGFSRTQLPLDDDVVEFYRTTQWETLGADDAEDSKNGKLPDDAGWAVDLAPGSPEKKAEVSDWQKSLAVSPYF